MSMMIILCHLHRLLVAIRCLRCFAVDIHEHLNKRLFFGEEATDKNARLLLFYDLEKENHNLLCINHEDQILKVTITSYPLSH
jgi:hypothetical protein